MYQATTNYFILSFYINNHRNFLKKNCFSDINLETIEFTITGKSKEISTSSSKLFVSIHGKYEPFVYICAATKTMFQKRH